MIETPQRVNRCTQIVLLLGVVPASWMCMLLVHEFGHMLGAIATGGGIERVIWHPLVISRTDVAPNPSPAIVVWAGPIVSVVIPILFYAMTILVRFRYAFLLGFFAGFCLLANGLYIGVGTFDPVGDAKVMLDLGSPRWMLAAFGLPCATVGLWLWNRVSPSFGFGHEPEEIRASVALGSVAVSIVIVAIGFLIGNAA